MPPVIKALSLGLSYGGSEGDTGESGAGGIVAGGGEMPRSLKLGLRNSCVQPRLDAAGQRDELSQPLAAVGPLRLRQVHSLGCALEAAQQ